MKKGDIKNKTREELQALVKEKEKALQAFRFGIAGSKIKNVKEGRGLRRDIARVITALGELSRKK